MLERAAATVRADAGCRQVGPRAHGRSRGAPRPDGSVWKMARRSLARGWPSSISLGTPADGSADTGCVLTTLDPQPLQLGHPRAEERSSSSRAHGSRSPRLQGDDCASHPRGCYSPCGIRLRRPLRRDRPESSRYRKGTGTPMFASELKAILVTIRSPASTHAVSIGTAAAIRRPAHDGRGRPSAAPSSTSCSRWTPRTDRAAILACAREVGRSTTSSSFTSGWRRSSGPMAADAGGPPTGRAD